MRHVPTLRSKAVEVVVTILHRLHAMGKGQSPQQPLPRPQEQAGDPPGGDSTMADTREGAQATAAEAAVEAAEEVNSAAPSAMDVDGGALALMRKSC